MNEEPSECGHAVTGQREREKEEGRERERERERELLFFFKKE